MKKILSLILAALMTASCAAFVAADDAAVEDAAVETTADAAVEEVAVDPAQAYAIEFLANYGIFKGTSATEMVADADADIQRYQMALFVSRISTGWVDDAQWEDGPANNSKFDDINDEPANKYLGALSYANQEGIIEGYSASKFAPYDGITYRDALTMVARTLGYKGLSYPWGYIQQAVELGLTAGVDAAYTDTLTRGEVAVIIYNALFAEKKAGGTLAKSIFDVDFGWENIVIVSTDEAGFEVSGVYKDETDRATAGFVGFRILDDKGQVSGKTYFVKSSEFGFEGHEEEIEVGAIYTALFEKTSKTDLVEMISVASLNFKTIVNNGITDNAGVAYDKDKLPILKEIAEVPYALKGEKAGDQYVTFMGNELLTYQAGTYTFWGEDNTRVGIDMSSGDLLKMADDGTWTVEWHYKKELDRYYQYYYDHDDTTNKAYDVDGKNEKDDVNTTAYNSIVINWMSDKEFQDWYAEAVKVSKGTETRWTLVESPSAIGKDPYATIRLYDTDLDDLAEVATYKKYDLGYFSNSKKKCGVNADGVNHTNTEMPTYVIKDMNNTEKVNQFVEADHEKHDPNNSTVARGKGYAWMNVADYVTGFENADGSYNAGYVLYNFNETTGELEVVKYISPVVGAENMDEDSYVITGVMQAFSTKNTSITVDGVTYKYGYDSKATGYSDLAGINSFLKKGDANQASRQLSGYYLDQLLMQYVTVVVLDGIVVDVDALNASSDSVIVVMDYAGITSDGYIAVYGYSTTDGVLGLYKINSYNGWKQGDYRYNPWNAADDDAFTFGTIYTVNSYDKATDSYGVYTYDVSEYAKEIDKRVNISFDDGYRVVTNLSDETITSDDITIEDQKASDVYILIQNTDAKTGGFINVAAGYEMDEEQVTGKQLYGKDGKYVILVDTQDDFDKGVYYIDTTDKDKDGIIEVYAGNTSWVGTTERDAETDLGSREKNMTYDERFDALKAKYWDDAKDAAKWTVEPAPYKILTGYEFTKTMNGDIGYFLYIEEDDLRGVVEAAYDDAQIKDIYLLGSTWVEFYALNVFTGKYDYVVASSNIDLESGSLYKTVGNTVIGIVDENVLANNNNVDAEDSFKGIFDLLDESFGEFYYANFKEGDNRGLTTVRDTDGLDKYFDTFYDSTSTSTYTKAGLKHTLIVTDDEDDNDKDTVANSYLKVELAKDLGLIETSNEAVAEKIAAKAIASLKVVNIAKDKYGDYSFTDLTDTLLNEDTEYTYFALYNADTKHAVIYIVAEDTVAYKTDKITVGDKDNWGLIEASEEVDHYVASKVFDLAGEVVKADKGIKSITVKEVYYGWEYTHACDDLDGTCPEHGENPVKEPSGTWFTNNANAKEVSEADADDTVVLGNATEMATTVEACDEELQIRVQFIDKKGNKEEKELFHYNNLEYVKVGTSDAYVSMIGAKLEEGYEMEVGDSLWVVVTRKGWEVKAKLTVNANGEFYWNIQNATQITK